MVDLSYVSSPEVKFQQLCNMNEKVQTQELHSLESLYDDHCDGVFPHVRKNKEGRSKVFRGIMTKNSRIEHDRTNESV